MKDKDKKEIIEGLAKAEMAMKAMAISLSELSLAMQKATKQISELTKAATKK